MEKITIDEILKSTQGNLIKEGIIREFTNISTDSRDITEGDIFIALHGERFNGNEFVLKAVSGGAKLCIVDDFKFSTEEFDEPISIVLVKDTKRALMDIAKYYRNKLNIKIIGITGSTGKTSTKDITAAALSGKFKVFKTQGNFNNEIGLPKMIFKLDNSYDIAVLEMGMSDFGEIHNLAEIAKPDIAMITNIGISHIESLKTRENILKAKLEITDFFDKDSILLLNNDNDMLEEYHDDKMNIIRIGTKGDTEYFADEVELKERGIKYKFVDKLGKNDYMMNLNIPGKHNVLNSLLAFACARLFDMPFDEIEKGFKNYDATSMRLDVIKGKKFTIINDCYNASPDSMFAAIDVLCGINGKRHIAILGDMKELGDKTEEAHISVAKYAREKNIDLLYAVGECKELYEEGFNSDEKFEKFNNNDELIEYLHEKIKNEDVLLVKASRTCKFEHIIKELEKINQ